MGDKPCKKLVKVDNWGMFFLQRLQQHFSRDEFCDFTLQFTNGEKVKAHRLVLDVCTEYFQILQNQGLFNGNLIHMPEDMLPDVVIPVVNFMYTGRLEFRADIQERLYATAQKMKMTVLTKLLDAQSLNSQQQIKTQQAAKSKVNQVVTPKKIPAGTFTNLQGKKVTPRIVDPNLPVTLPGRKLPIWKRRSIPIYSQTSHTSTSNTQFDQPIRIISSPAVSEPPRPTRFEWPDDTDDPSTSPLAATFEDISYESKPLMQLRQPKPSVSVKEKAPATPVPAEKKATFEDVYRTGAVGLAKRPAADPISPEATKKAKTMDLQAMKEYVQEARVRSHMIEGEDSDDDVDDDLAEAEMNNDEDEEDDEDFEDANYEPVVQPHKSILKNPSSADDESPSNKRVRFSVDDVPSAEKENEVKTPEARTLPTRALSNITSSSTPTATNHAKIISEVLKKYPHLVKNNKNIRLKIMQRGGPSQVPVERDTSNKPVKSKVSYVVLKSDVATSKGRPMATPGATYVVPPPQRTTFPSKPFSGAQNVTGPWLCHTCGTNDEPVNFETYYSYRHHLQDVHMEKIDARICDHCGHRASKRNLLLYHQYTKHNIAPPRNCQFPKCDQCEYVALSESLLIKHRNNHSSGNRDYVCRVCNAAFKSNGALAGHMQTNLHSSKKGYECPYCNKPFVRNINLKAHIRSNHQDMAKRVDEEDVDEMEFDENELAEEDSEMEVEDGEGMMEVPVIDVMNETASGMTILAEAPASLEPSSEAEGLSHVASGIATSLGLTDGQQTVILLDNNQEYILHTSEEDGNEYADVDGTLVQEGEGYVVPELMAEEATQMEGEGGDDEEEDEDEEDEEDAPVESYRTGPDVVPNSGEVLMVLTDHCYAEDKEDNQLKENHSQNTIHLQTNELGGLDFVRQENTVAAAMGPVVADNQKPNRVIFTNKSRQFKMSASPSAAQRSTTNAVAPSAVVVTPPPVKKPAVEMSHLLDDWDEECTEDGEEEKGSTVPNSQGAMPTRDEMYAVPSTIVEEDSFLPQQSQESLMEEDEPCEPIAESRPLAGNIKTKLLVHGNFDKGQEDGDDNADSDSKEPLAEFSTLAHSTEVEADVDNRSSLEDSEESTAAGFQPSASTTEESGISYELSTGVEDQKEVFSTLIEVNQNDNLSQQEAEDRMQCSQGNAEDTNEESGESSEVVENNHSMQLSEGNEIDDAESAEVAYDDSVVNAEPEQAEGAGKDVQTVSLSAEAPCHAIETNQAGKD